MGVVGGDESLKHPAAAGRWHSLSTKHVFDGHRQAGQPAQWLTRCTLLVDGGGLVQCPLGINQQKGLNALVVLLNPVQISLGDLTTGDVALLHALEQFAGSGIDCGHGIGTLRERRQRLRVPLKDLWDQETLSIGLGGIGKRRFTRQRISQFVVSKDVAQFRSVSHGVDAVGVDLVQNVDILQDLPELRREHFEFGVRELQPGQQCDVGHIVTRQPSTHSSPAVVGLFRNRKDVFPCRNLNAQNESTVGQDGNVSWPTAE